MTTIWTIGTKGISSWPVESDDSVDGLIRRTDESDDPKSIDDREKEAKPGRRPPSFSAALSDQ
jgi:hypothetical protein